MTDPVTDTFLASMAEARRRNPHPSKLLPEPWSLPLFRIHGQERLGHLPIYYDFRWESVIGHRRKAFPNGQSLAYLVRRECPKDKYPALLLTVRTDVQEKSIHTYSHFVVIVRINDYLKSAYSSPDAATNYFAKAIGTDVTSLAALKEAAATPAGMDFLLSVINVEQLKKWADGNSEVMMALAEVVATKGFSEVLRVLKIEDVAKVLDWIAVNEGADRAREIIERVREDSLPSLYTLTGIMRLRKALDRWTADSQNSSEEFWQQELGNNSFVLCQLFSQPVVIFREKAYVGGKLYDNTKGNVIDFLCKNNLTRNFVLIEIKTPCTSLIGGQYRGDVVNVSSDLTGAVLQASNYKQRLIENRLQLTQEEDESLYSFDPPTVVIIGNSSELDSPGKTKAFEHFRNGLKSIQVITFDEMYSKLQSLLGVLEGVPSPTSSIVETKN